MVSGEAIGDDAPHGGAERQAGPHHPVIVLDHPMSLVVWMERARQLLQPERDAMRLPRSRRAPHDLRVVQ
jgi:hypothetical protein